MAQSVWTGGSHHTGLAALPHENIHLIKANELSAEDIQDLRDYLDELDLMEH